MSKSPERAATLAGEQALLDHYKSTRGTRHQTWKRRAFQIGAPLFTAFVLLPAALNSLSGGEAPESSATGGDNRGSSADGGTTGNMDSGSGEGVVPQPSESTQAAGGLYCKLAGITALPFEGSDRIRTVLANLDVQGTQLDATGNIVHAPLIQEGTITPGSDANAKINPDQSVAVEIPADSDAADVYGLYLQGANGDEASCGGFYVDGTGSSSAHAVSGGQLPPAYN